VKEPAEIPCDNINNPSDPDSSYNAHHGQGYMVQVMETYRPTEPQPKEPDGGAEPPQASGPAAVNLITHVRVHPMTVPDNREVAPAVEGTAARKVAPRLLTADTRYGSPESYRFARTRRVRLVAPAYGKTKAKGEKRLSLEQFQLDRGGQVLACPAGVRPVRTGANRKYRWAAFEKAVCLECEHRSRCLAAAGLVKRGSAPRVSYTPARVRQRARRLYEQTDAFRNVYRWRAGIEATMGKLKHQMGLSRLRVRGMKAVHYTVVLRALGLNILRVAAARGGG
jgi:hypothetical protein